MLATLLTELSEIVANQICNCRVSTGCPKKMSLLSGFEFLKFGGVFLGVKNNSENFGDKKKYNVVQPQLVYWPLIQ